LETENIRGTRIKATLDHLEINVGDGRLDNIKSSAEKKLVVFPQLPCCRDSYTLRSIPTKKEASLLGYFINGNSDECHFIPLKSGPLIMDNVKEPVKMSELGNGSHNGVDDSATSMSPAKPTVVSVRMRTEAEIFGAKRAASRRKTADNDDDLRYLSQLFLVPWKPATFRTHKPMYAFEHRSALMCSVESASIGGPEFTRDNWEALLLSPLREEALETTRFGNELKKAATLEDLVRSQWFFSVSARVIKFDKLLECLRERSPDKNLVTPAAVIPILNRLAVLVRGWWVVRSDILYPPNTYSEHASVPSTQLIRARDYVMAVFHQGDHLTRKTVSSITKLPSLEVTEILEQLGTRISSDLEGHNNHWEFRQPDMTFINKHVSRCRPSTSRKLGASNQTTMCSAQTRGACHSLSDLKVAHFYPDATQRRRRCSGRLSGSDSDEILTPLSPKLMGAKRPRCRLLSLSPEASGPTSKRVRTQSASSAGHGVSPHPPSSPHKNPLPNRPTPPLFSAGLINKRHAPSTSKPSQNDSLERTGPTPPSSPPLADSSLRLVTDPSTDLLKQEPSSPERHHNGSETEMQSLPPTLMEAMPTINAGAPEKLEEPDSTTEQTCSMVDDPAICSFVREKLHSHPILALSELTKACQPFLASLANQMTNGKAAPPGSEAEREMLKSELYKVVLAVGGRELHIQWPDVPSALPKQPLFVAPVAVEFGDPSSPLHQAREAILERFETSTFVTYGIIKKKLTDVGLKIPDNTLRTTIKSELAVHHGKVREVREVCMMAKTKSRCVVVLTGPPGSSKSTCLLIVCRTLGFSYPLIWTEGNWEGGDATTNELQQFEDFLFKSTHYFGSGDESKVDFSLSGLSQCLKTPQLVLIESLPSGFSDNPLLFHKCIRSALSDILVPTLLAFVFTKSSSVNNIGTPVTSNFDATALSRLFPNCLKQELGICHIEFNPIAPVIMTRALSRIVELVSNETGASMPPKPFLQQLAASSSGDIRLAINTLQFAIMPGLGDSTSCNESFLPPHLLSWKRTSLSFNPETILNQSGLTGDDVVAWLHENYLAFHDTPALFEALEWISSQAGWADAHLSGGMNWRLGLTPAADRNSFSSTGTACSAGSHYAAIAVSRAIAICSSTKVIGNTSSKFRPLKAPQLKQVEARQRSSLQALRASFELSVDVLRTKEALIDGLRWYLLDRLPLEFTILGSRFPGSIEVISSLCRFQDPNGVGERDFRRIKVGNVPMRGHCAPFDGATDADAEVTIDENFSDEECPPSSL
uniref:SH2 domain-containing protein n=1 Tax=Hydatigena taeniaeformis TaxID=6205 RepID=A0A0R3WIG4_HYDTA